MLETALTQKHIALGARMAEFAGYNMPISYTSISEEHMAVRKAAGLFDVSHMGEFIIKGKEALDLVQYVISNDASRLEIGQALYAYLPNQTGGIVDDLLVYRLDEDQCSEGEQAFMLVVNAANIEKDFQWIKANNTFDTRLIDISGETGLLALQGPGAAGILKRLTEYPVDEIPFYQFVKTSVAGTGNILVSATGYTGSGGFELYGRNDQIGVLWDAILEAGKPDSLIPVGLGARDTLRLEMGYCLYGNEITEETSPWEAGLGWITKMKKEKFVGKELLSDLKHAVQRKLVGIRVEDRRVPRPHYEIFSGEVKIGEITSGTLSPSLGIPIGLGYVKSGFHNPGTKVLVSTGKKSLEAEVVKLPFVNPGK